MPEAAAHQCLSQDPHMGLHASCLTHSHLPGARYHLAVLRDDNHPESQILEIDSYLPKLEAAGFFQDTEEVRELFLKLLDQRKF